MDKLSGLYVAEIKRKYKDKEYITYLLRRSFREGGRVKQQTLANITHLPPPTRELIRQHLKGQTFVPLDQGMEIVASYAHGHVAAVRSMLRQLGVHELIASRPSSERDIIEACIVARVVSAQPKFPTTQWWTTTTLPEDLEIEDATEDDVYAAMDWLLQRQSRIEKKLATRHLQDGSLVLYDVSSSYYEGSHCPLAGFGYNRDGKKGKRQIVYGLMTDAEGRPIAVQVYPGPTADSATVEDQIEKLRRYFSLKRVVLAGDRGMLTNARIARLRENGGIDWVSALRGPAIPKLVKDGCLQPSLFDEKELMEIASDAYPGERLVVCRNPFLAEERRRKRQELLLATEEKLDALARRVAAGRLKRKEKIGEALGRIANRYKMAKHFEFTVEEGRFSYRRNKERIAEEAALDGFYVIRTSVPQAEWEAEEAVLAYKSLSHAERAFRTLKGVDLKVRPIHHRLPNRVRAHVFLCLLAYYVEWHLRRAWAPLLFDDEHPGSHMDNSVVLPAQRSQNAKEKTHRSGRHGGLPTYSFRTLLAQLSTVIRNTVRIPALPELGLFHLVTQPSPLQRQAFEAVGLKWTQDKLQTENRTVN